MRRASLRSLFEDPFRGGVSSGHDRSSAAKRDARPSTSRPAAAAFLAGLTVALIAVLGAASASADLIEPPSIESESVSLVTTTDANLEAQINPSGLRTTYRFRLESGCLAPRECAVIQVYPLPSKELPASTEAQPVSLDLNNAGVTLQPNTEYAYSVEATNAASTTKGLEKRFTTPGAPVIESESASHITATDATLEASVYTGGLETSYEFHLVTAPPCVSGECPQHELTLPSGKLIGSFMSQSVSLELNGAGVSLKRGERYEYWITATNSDGTAGSESQAHVFTAASQEGPPSITSESVSHVTASDATLEAAIEPRALAGAFYQFQLVKEPSEYASEILCPPPPWGGYSACIGTRSEGALPIGFVCGNCENISPAQPVQLDLASVGVTLEPSTTYHYRVIAARAVKTEDTIQWEPPIVYGADQTFSTPSPSVTQPPTTSGSNQSSSMSSAGSSSPTVIPPPLGPLLGDKTQSLTNAQRLSKALKACAKKSKAKRAACRKQAHKKYGTVAENSKTR